MYQIVNKNTFESWILKLVGKGKIITYFEEITLSTCIVFYINKLSLRLKVEIEVLTKPKLKFIKCVLNMTEESNNQPIENAEDDRRNPREEYLPNIVRLEPDIGLGDHSQEGNEKLSLSLTT